MEQQQRIKAELEEEERKKKAKEEQGRKVADDAKRLADEKKRQENVPANKKSNQVKQMNKKFQRTNNPDNNSIQESQLELQEQPSNEFRSNSPPVPAAAKKISAEVPKVKPVINKSKQKETTANYYVTESRLNLNLASSPVIYFFVLFCFTITLFYLFHVPFIFYL
jgi:membrane protein involved in colicin uptake